MFLAFFLLTLVSLSLTAKDETNNDEAITQLDLSNKQLTSLNDYDFSKYPLLEELDLSNNQIESIKENEFKDNKHLKKVNLSGNKKLKLPKFSTLLIAELEYLNLSDCNIEELPSSILDGLTHLRVIDLSQNPLKKAALITFSNLESLEKIVLPNFKNKPMIKEICTELKNIILVSDKGVLTCADVQSGNWEISENADGIQYNTTSEHEHENASSEEEIEVGAPNSPEINDEPGDIVAKTVNDTEPDVPDTKNVVKDDVEPDVPDTINANNDKDAKTLTDVPDSKTVKENLPDTKKENDTNKEESKTTEKTNLSNDKPNSDDEEHKIDVLDNGAKKPEAPQETDKKSMITSTDSKVKNDQEVDANKNTVPLVAQIPLVSTDQKSPVPVEEPTVQKVDTPVVQRIAPPQLPPKTENDATLNKQVRVIDPTENQPQQIKQEDGSEAPTGASTPASTGTNILIILVVAVIISGIAAFGYRFYKTRTYRQASTQEPIERELQEIVTDKKTNGPLAGNGIEEEPLMQKNENSPVNETKENNDVNHMANSKPYVPITSINTENVK